MIAVGSDHRGYRVRQRIMKFLKEQDYSYKDFYSAFMIFQELGIIKFNKIDDMFHLKINKDIKSDLADSKIYNMLKILKQSNKQIRN